MTDAEMKAAIHAASAPTGFFHKSVEEQRLLQDDLAAAEHGRGKAYTAFVGSRQPDGTMQIHSEVRVSAPLLKPYQVQVKEDAGQIHHQITELQEFQNSPDYLMLSAAAREKVIRQMRLLRELAAVLHEREKTF